MHPDDLLRAIQSRAARIAVGASTVRGRGHTGTVREARHHFSKMDLRVFGVASSRFRAVLDRETLRLQSALPIAARRWGIARKLLNIFLRDCFYTGQLSEAYRLATLETEFEIPTRFNHGKSPETDHGAWCSTAMARRKTPNS